MDFNSFLKSLLALGQGKVSDLHFKAGGPPLLRVRGVLEPARFNPLTPDDTKRIATALIRHAIEWMRGRGMAMAKIETLEQNARGQSLYPKLGFQEVARQVHYVMPLPAEHSWSGR